MSEYASHYFSRRYRRLSRRRLFQVGDWLMSSAAASACAAPPPRRASPAAPSIQSESKQGYAEATAGTSEAQATSMTSATSSPSGLRSLADRIQLRFGSAVSDELFKGPLQQTMLDIYARDFNLATIHSSFYWSVWEPQPGQISSSAVESAKQQIAAMHSIGITDLRGHPLVFPTVEPQWLTDQMLNGKIKKAQAAELLVNHVRTMVEQFRGEIGEWVVVNEPFRFYSPTRGDLWKILLGEDYVEMAFRAAREADPQAKLLLNDYDNHARSGRGVYTSDQDPITRNKTLVQRLQAKGLIDGIGLQMHIRADKPLAKDDLIATMRSYGVPVHITELDVNLKEVQGTDAERFAQQARVYADVLEAALQSGVCQSFCFWEFGDKYSWLENPYFDFASPLTDATPYDDALKPKPAYEAMRRVLSRSA